MILAYEAVIRPACGVGVRIFTEHTDFRCSVIATTEQEANDAIAAFKAHRGDRRAILRNELPALRDVDFAADTVVWRAYVRFLRFNDVAGDMEPAPLGGEPQYL